MHNNVKERKENKSLKADTEKISLSFSVLQYYIATFLCRELSRFHLHNIFFFNIINNNCTIM